MAIVERIASGASLKWATATVVKVVDYEYGFECPAEDVTAQADGGHRDYIAGLAELIAHRFTIIYDILDTVHATLNTAFHAGTAAAVEFTAPDGVIYDWTCIIEELSEHAPLGSVVKADLVLALQDRDTVLETGL